MQIDLLKMVVAELAEKLPNARVAKIHQPAADVLIFRLWNGRENLRLLISAAANSSRIHLTAASYPNPFTPPRFCQLLRARVTRILSIELLNGDRIVSIHCRGPKGEIHLVVELTGRGSNMLLIDADKVIIDSLRRVTGESCTRQIVPGKPYCLPEKNQAAMEETVISMEEVAGLSVNDAVDRFYTHGQRTENKSDLSAILKKSVASKRKKLERRLEAIAMDLRRQLDPEPLKQSGELLLANMHAVRRGMEAVEILNYYLHPPELVTILLDSRLGPQDNAEAYFKRYKKAKRGLLHSQRRRQETQDELDWLASVDYLLNEAAGAADIEELAAECRQSGLLSAAADRYVKKPQNIVSAPHETLSPSGFKILWGRNNKQNDYLTSKVLKATDLWLHAYQCPGAHVVLKAASSFEAVPVEDLLYAAALAAGYSRARQDNKVEVMIAEPKQVLKPKGARPGLVTVRQYKTLIVAPLRID